MSKSSTNGVSRLLVYAREQGIIPWEWVVDETREAERVAAWDDPERFAEAVQRSYRRNRWADQPQQVEVWSEKGTVRGTLAPVLNRYGVTFRVMHGYGSATVINDIAGETAGLENALLALYVGDWDPSGLHMSEVDLSGRLERYSAYVELERLALTREQIAKHGLPSFEAITKSRDSRYRWFVERFGHHCWELDALNPVVLRETVEARIVEMIDPGYWARIELVEAAERKSLVEIMGTWRRIVSDP